MGLVVIKAGCPVAELHSKITRRRAARESKMAAPPTMSLLMMLVLLGQQTNVQVSNVNVHLFD